MAVSCTTNPVTQVADVAVNNASKKDAPCPSCVAIGNVKNKVPNKITEKALNETSVKFNPSGSVLIAMYGATIGKLGILSFPATTNQACCACNVFQPFYNLYLFYFLMANKIHFVKQGEGGAQPNISREKIVKTLIPVPPINEQES